MLFKPELILQTLKWINLKNLQLANSRMYVLWTSCIWWNYRILIALYCRTSLKFHRDHILRPWWENMNKFSQQSKTHKTGHYGKFLYYPFPIVLRNRLNTYPFRAAHIHPPVEWEHRETKTFTRKTSQPIGNLFVCPSPGLSEFRIKRTESDWLFWKEAELSQKVKVSWRMTFCLVYLDFICISSQRRCMLVATETDRDRDFVRYPSFRS